MKAKQWNKRTGIRGQVKIHSHEPDLSETIHYLTLEDWLANMEKVGKAVLLPSTKEFIIRMWWIHNLMANLKLRGKF